MPFLKSVVTQLKQYKSGKFYSDEFRGDLSWNGSETNNLLRNEGIGEDGLPRFADVAMATGADDAKDARGMAVADFDNDGDLDIVICCNQGGREASAPPVLLRNDIGQTRNRLVVDLDGIESNRDAIGAKVLVTCVDQEGNSVQMMRHVSAGSGYASQSSDRLFFGTGSYDRIEKLTVRWPSGKVHEFEDLSTNQLLHISEAGDLSETEFGGSTAAAERKVALRN